MALQRRRTGSDFTPLECFTLVVDIASHHIHSSCFGFSGRHALSLWRSLNDWLDVPTRNCRQRRYILRACLEKEAIATYKHAAIHAQKRRGEASNGPVRPLSWGGLRSTFVRPPQHSILTRIRPGEIDLPMSPRLLRLRSRPSPLSYLHSAVMHGCTHFPHRMRNLEALSLL
ncbi:hypothetical protein OE88DRAFT_1221879 [Heliocybe sulcata]|uniref:Uncharacterized protein n=1 Tax=Heliocybe sulcata TaxID=5364 RepID=A0A5C3MIV2_9AGAM|nr:hypothetical protein OE88DRAFT_1221879 [Heliocybe sulcata]